MKNKDLLTSIIAGAIVTGVVTAINEISRKKREKDEAEFNKKMEEDLNKMMFRSCISVKKEPDGHYAISVSPFSIQEDYIVHEIIPMCQKPTKCRLGAIIGQTKNTYVIDAEDYERVKSFLV